MEVLPDTSSYFRINELKNYCYCPRISFYTLCLSIDRETGLSRTGIEAEAEVKTLMKRRKRALHAVVDGMRHFDVQVVNHQLKLIGRLDEVIETEQGLYLVDYKDTAKDFGYWRVQMAAYQYCLEEEHPVRGCYIYTIPTRKYQLINHTAKDRQALFDILRSLQDMVITELCPPPISQVSKCRVCQYARFCNDIF